MANTSFTRWVRYRHRGSESPLADEISFRTPLHLLVPTHYHFAASDASDDLFLPLSSFTIIIAHCCRYMQLEILPP